MATFNANEFNRKLRQAQRQAEQQLRAAQQRAQQQARQQLRAAERELQRQVDAENRRIQERNRRVDRAVTQHNRAADAHNKKVINEINRRLAQAAQPQVVVRYTLAEQEMVDRVHAALPVDDRESDLFCSYAHIDGADVTDELYAQLTALGLRS